jgi:hypothetical protein
MRLVGLDKEGYSMDDDATGKGWYVIYFPAYPYTASIGAYATGRADYRRIVRQITGTIPKGSRIEKVSSY